MEAWRSLNLSVPILGGGVRVLLPLLGLVIYSLSVVYSLVVRGRAYVQLCLCLVVLPLSVEVCSLMALFPLGGVHLRQLGGGEHLRQPDDLMCIYSV